MRDIYICNHDTTEKLSSNFELNSEYFTWDKFQVVTINISLRFHAEL